jgi:hypothetical protein
MFHQIQGVPMSIKTVLLSEFERLSTDERARVLSELVRSSQSLPNGEIDELDRRISEFEIRYEMSSATMQQQYRNRSLRETADICHWLMLLNMKDRIVRAAS